MLKLKKKDDDERIIKQQSKLTLNRVHNPYTKYDGYRFREKEVFVVRIRETDEKQFFLMKLKAYLVIDSLCYMELCTPIDATNHNKCM